MSRERGSDFREEGKTLECCRSVRRDWRTEGPAVPNLNVHKHGTDVEPQRDHFLDWLSRNLESDTGRVTGRISPF